MVRVIDSVTAIRKAPAPGDGCPFPAQTASSRRCSDSVSNVRVEQTKSGRSSNVARDPHEKSAAFPARLEGGLGDRMLEMY